nr:hypothetical protein [Tanacetum cinerariifolium]
MNDGNKVHIKIEGIASLEDMNTIKSLQDSLSTSKSSALFGLPNDDSGRDDSNVSASGSEQKVSKKEAPPSKTSLSKKKNTNEDREEGHPGIPFTEIRRVLGERWAF